MLDKPLSETADARADAGTAGVGLAVLIVGMHRSGTSALSGVLNMLGVAAPEDLIPADEHNTKGYFEPERIINFHEALLARLGSPSNDPLPLSYDWVKSPVGVAAAAELADILGEEFGDNAMCLFKDPRICRLAPVWTEALARSGRPGVAVLPFRHPLEVAGSLRVKGALSRPYALFMWLQHVVLGERFTRGMPRSFASYNALLDDWRAVAEKMQRELAVTWPRDLLRAAPEIDAFLSGEMRHHSARSETLEPHEALDALCARAWAALQILNGSANDPAAIAEMDAIWAAFESGLGVYGPLVVSYQRTEARLRDEMGGQYAALTREVLSRDDIVTDQHRRLTESFAQIQARDRMIAAGTQQMGALQQQRRKDQEGIQWLRGEVGRRDRELSARIAELEALHPALHASQVRLAEIEGSTSWAMTHKLRSILTNHPAFARLLRRSAKLAWWTVSLQLFRRLKLRRQLLDGVAPPPLEPAPEALAAEIPAQIPAAVEARPQGVTRIVFVSGEAHTPGHLYRIERPAAAARLLGAEVTVVRSQDLFGALGAVRGADIVVVWRATWNDAIAAMYEQARAGGAAVLFDVDDLMFEPDLAFTDMIDGIRSQDLVAEEVAAYFDSIRRTLMAADYGLAPTGFLAHRIRRLLKPAFVVPNGFDDEVVRKAREAVHAQKAVRADDLIRIGYATGSKTHQQDFAKAAPAVARILREHPEARLVVFVKDGLSILDINEFPDFFGLTDQVEQRDFVPLEQLPFELARFDINLAPLEVGNLFCEAKSELKFFEAALVDVPTIASPTEPYRQAIRDGETGFLADDTEAWYAALKTLVADPRRRAAMSRSAFYDVLSNYGAERRAELMMSLIEQVKPDRRRAARAFELDLVRGARPPAKTPFVPEHEAVFVFDSGPRSRVTVIVPLHNYAGFVVEALESVRAQTLADVDLIVVNDASTDDSEAVALAWLETNAGRFNRALLLRNVQNAGLGFTRNVGFAEAETPFVLPLDADNRLLPECAERLLAAAEAEGAAFAYPLIRQFGDTECMMGEFAFDPVRFAYSNYIDAMALIRRSSWAAAGGYEHIRHGWEDFELWCRFTERGFFAAQVGEILAEYRVHGQSMLRTQTEQARNKIRLIRDMERRHPWLRIDRTPLWGEPVPDEEPVETPPSLAVDASERTDGEIQLARLERLLPLMRSPRSGAPLRLEDGAVVEGQGGGTVRWPLVLGRPVLFEGLEPQTYPAGHISNPLPDRAIELIEATKGPVLNLSAGGTALRFDHVVEAEVGVFAHTDVVADVHALPFADGVFDLVVSMNAFEHYHTPNQAAAEIMRVLKPGGQVLIRTAFLQPLHEAPWHFYNATRHGLERWFEAFETLDLQVSDIFNPIYALTWQLSEAEFALRRELTGGDAERLLNATGRDLVNLWRDPDGRDTPLWHSFFALPQKAQEQLAAGFEYLGRKPG